MLPPAARRSELAGGRAGRCVQHRLGSGGRGAGRRATRRTASSSRSWSAPAVPVRVLQATLQQLDGSAHAAGGARRPMRCPRAASSAAACASALQPQLSGALPGMRRFFETYPFICLEQKTSQGASACSDAALWARGGQRAADLPRQRRPGELLPAARRRRPRAAATGSPPTCWRPRTRPASSCRPPARERDARRPGGLRRRPHRAQASGRRAPTSTCASSPRIEALSRHGRAQPRMLGSINLDAQPVADRGGDRLAARSCAASTASPTRPSGSTRRSRSCAPAHATPARRCASAPRTTTSGGG